MMFFHKTDKPEFNYYLLFKEADMTLSNLILTYMTC